MTDTNLRAAVALVAEAAIDRLAPPVHLFGVVFVSGAVQVGVDNHARSVADAPRTGDTVWLGTKVYRVVHRRVDYQPVPHSIPRELGQRLVTVEVEEVSR